MASCCHGCVKYTMFFVNIIFLLVGILIAVGGILGIVYKKQLEVVNTGVFIGIIVLGVIVFFIAFCGCCGAINEVDCLVLTYSIILLLLAILKIAFAIYLLVNKPTWKDNLTDFLSESEKNHMSTNNFTRSEFGVIEFLVQCCGTTGPDSYTDLFELHDDQVPATCCPTDFKKTTAFCDKADAHTEGCSEEASLDKLMNYVNLLAYAAIGVALFEIAGFVSSVYLSCSMNSRDKYHGYD